MDRCTREDGSVCTDCDLCGRLHCRPDPALTRSFVSSQLPYLILAPLGLANVWLATGVLWPLPVYLLFGLAFLGPVGMRFLCSHCPFYAREGRRLRCMAPNPFPKLFRYRPWPMSGLERMVIILSVVFILAFPAAVQGYGIWTLASGTVDVASVLAAVWFEAGTVLFALLFYRVLTRRFCTRCVNISCPLNRVAPDLARSYLEMNPAMRAAWAAKEAGDVEWIAR